MKPVKRRLQTTDIREQAAQHTPAANPLVGIRAQDIVDSTQACCSAK